RLALRNVRAIDWIETMGPVEESGAIAGVRVRARRGGLAEDHERSALVVDASGRHTRLPDWLAQIGRPKPQEIVVDGRLGYASRVYHLTNPTRLQWRGGFGPPAPPAPPPRGRALPA